MEKFGSGMEKIRILDGKFGPGIRDEHPRSATQKIFLTFGQSLRIRIWSQILITIFMTKS
jgi:hypothetical protein